MVVGPGRGIPGPLLSPPLLPLLPRPPQRLARGAPSRLPPKCRAQGTPGPATWWSARAGLYPVSFQAHRDYRGFLVPRRAQHGGCLADHRPGGFLGGFPRVPHAGMTGSVAAPPTPPPTLHLSGGGPTSSTRQVLPAPGLTLPASDPAVTTTAAPPCSDRGAPRRPPPKCRGMEPPVLQHDGRPVPGLTLPASEPNATTVASSSSVAPSTGAPRRLPP
jgi:hypothetical protein